MARRRHISAVISLKDNMSATMRGIRREQRQFQREVRQTRAAIRSANRERMRIRMDATPAHRVIENLRRKMQPLRTKLATVVAMKDETTAKLNRIKSNMKSVGKFIAKPVVLLRDKATSAIKKVSKSIKSIAKKVTIPIALAAGAVGATVKSGMELEQQQISMRHFMGVGNKGKSSGELDTMSSSYLKSLRDNANATPFETGEVIGAGTRALQIAGGNSKDAMQMVKLAEDMSALNPGKTVGDAMEALADANVGEMERLKEFGLKASSKDNPKEVQKKLQELYQGGAEKLATSGAGLWSTIMGKLKSNLADIGLGMLEPLKPVMDDIIGFIDSATPGMLALGQAITSGLATGIGWIQEQMPTLAPVFSSVFTTIQGVVQTVAPVIGQLIQSLGPVFSALMPIVQTVFSAIGLAVQTAAPIVSDLIQMWSPIFANVGSALTSLSTIFSSVFGGIMKTVEKAYNFVKPLIEGIGGAVSGISGAVSSGLGWIAEKMGKNATGTKYWKGGLSLVGEHGPELVQMPSGSKVYTNTETRAIANNTNSTTSTGSGQKVTSNSINIDKLADTIVVREDADIDKIAKALVEKIIATKLNYGGVY
ncbi:hypothetical protein [Terrisporobacter hibernicus]|uniref:Uncharacterized protein n=1 Tax=Terrisporobacter hibernicus TaxID=2813371 RepID=A0AAX2ZDM6_9FIRM|nr:hypothetical protein [Terrisporobacter hibernicus]UEL47358.1 hypothetical protein JW646_17270 [Terrisporobacter hibernicus]